MLAKNIGIGLFALASILLAGCATSGTHFTAAPAPAAGKALIYVYRPWHFVAGAAYDKIFINANFLADLKNGTYISCEAPAGPVTFAAIPRTAWQPVMIEFVVWVNLQTKKYERLKTEVEAGKTYYVRWHFNGIDVKMELIDEATALNEISDLKPAEITPLNEAAK